MGDMELTLQALLEEGARRLEEAGIGEAWLDARYLLCHAFQIDVTGFLLKRSQGLLGGAQAVGAVAAYRQLVGQRAHRIPLQHLIGNWEFMGLSFQVGPGALIPRQDTEILVEEVLRDHKGQDLEVLDMCTGSGCIALSLAVLGHFKVVGADVSPNALHLARDNGGKLDGQGLVSFLESDMFEGLKGFKGRFDLIVSNPPYIPAKDLEGLEPEVKDHEPRLALDGLEDGLGFYRILARQSPGFLKPGGGIYFEIGHNQAQAVAGLLWEAGFSQIQVVKDLPGLDRVVKAVYQVNTGGYHV